MVRFRSKSSSKVLEKVETFEMYQVATDVAASRGGVPRRAVGGEQAHGPIWPKWVGRAGFLTRCLCAARADLLPCQWTRTSGAAASDAVFGTYDARSRLHGPDLGL
jgi:hypothetical protein